MNATKYFSSLFRITCRFPPLQTLHIKRVLPIQYVTCLRLSHSSPIDFTKNTGHSYEDTSSIDNTMPSYFSINNNKEFNLPETVTSREVIELIKKCGRLNSSIPSSKRLQALNDLWKELEHKKFSFGPEHYNAYIQACTENDYKLHCMSFISTMKCECDPYTYKRLLENVCEHGDVEQSFTILNLIKDKKISIDKDDFDCLVLCHTIHNGLKAGEAILEMMRAAHFPDTENSRFCILRGLIIHKNENEFSQALRKYGFKLSESQFLQLLFDLGKHGDYTWLSQIKEFTDANASSRIFVAGLENVCLQLVNYDRAEAAVYFYSTLMVPIPEIQQGEFLIHEIVKTDSHPKVILNAANQLKTKGLNEFALENATEIALKHNKTEIAWELLKNMTTLRPHFFWPLLINAGKESGELGVLTTLQEMMNLLVKADAETLELYCLHFCDLTNPEALISRLVSVGYTVKEVLSPVIVILLSQGETKKAKELTDIHNAKIDGRRMIAKLAKTWLNDQTNTVKILQKICEDNIESVDYLGRFLNKIIRLCKTEDHYSKFMNTLKVLHKLKLQITPQELNTISNVLRKKYYRGMHFKDIQEILDSLVDMSQFSHKENQIYQHPQDMSLDQLECHLTELESKQMETRGVLRKLIRAHNNAGNFNRLEELKQKLLAKGYHESPGMKSSRMHSLTQTGDLTQAMDLYDEIKVIHPEFKIDSFKVLDLATLMVSNECFEEAVNIINTESEKKFVKGGPSVERNCFKLLSAAKTPEQANYLFELLTKYGYCKPSNVILGPLIRIQLQNKKYKEAVEAFVGYAKGYKCTPLSVELLRVLIVEKEHTMVDEVVQMIEQVHGTPAASLSVITALAEEGLVNGLMNYFMKSPSLPWKGMVQKQYDRWVKMKNLVALETVAMALKKLSIDCFDLPYVQSCIMRIHSENNDCQKALAYWQQLLDEEVLVPNEALDVLQRLLTRCKYELPDSLKKKIKV